MTDEELDNARALEAKRQSMGQCSPVRDAFVIAARLARLGWMPDPPVDPLLLEARRVCADNCNTSNSLYYFSGAQDGTHSMRSAYAALLRGIELGKTQVTKDR